MFKTLANAWKLKDLRYKLLFTLAIILVYRIGTAVPVPFVAEASLNTSGTVFGFLNTLSGGAFETGALFALGVSPYITASIVIQLLTVAIPPLERLSKQGEEGKKKITMITRYVTIAISVITAIGYYLLIKTNGLLLSFASEAYEVFAGFVIVACYVAGSCIVMWLGERINEKGIGNGISIILFANIVSRGKALLMSFINMFSFEVDGYSIEGAPFQGEKGYIYTAGVHSFPWASIIYTVLAIAFMLAMIWFVIFTSDSERRIPVQYAKRVVGRKMFGGQNTNIPLKLNMAGVMPIIFANAILTIPSTIAMFAKPEEGTFWAGVVDFFSNTSWFFALMSFILILAFAYFYVAISFNPTEVAGNLQKNGGAVPGIRPGKATAQYIQKVLSKVTFMGALVLSVISVLPLIIHVIISACGSMDAVQWISLGDYGYISFSQLNMADFFSLTSELAFSGTSVIIVVGVIIETVKEIEAQMTMRHYKGFLG